MITKLPRWIEFGAFLLAFIAGLVNVIGFLGFDRLAISHVSGTATLLGAALYDPSLSSTSHLAGVLVSFLLGAAISGFLLRGSALTVSHHYDTALMTEAALFFIAYLLLAKGSIFGYFAAATACGVQNALATSYSGAIVRTTHLTGIFTDLGIMIGMMVRGQTFDRRKAVLFLLIISGFLIGGIGGAFLFQSVAFKALLVPAVLCVALAFSFRRYRKRQKRVF
ncbi:YoaK family protein [Oceaniglobus ichthyenteri]|uniref:YoaK family protein n=1 Tax=Oceaniglobus ichthyenteri TaxID=2136177 RepID=UPI000D3691B0|nr:YoaK family protein [Oceaniglobus ichthyenteri]